MSKDAFSWTELPAEMKLTIVDNLDLEAAKSLSRIDRSSYQACLPITFRAVQLGSQNALRQFVDDVPRAYCRYIRSLELSTEDNEAISDATHCSEAVLALLLAAPCLESLTLNIYASLGKSVLPAFWNLPVLHTLSITNWEEDTVSPLSERLVVSIAASLPSLSHLSLENITRSREHAPELVGAFPPIPLAHNDGDIPMHPLLGFSLNLPSLLRIATLRTLSIRDTHLGDPQWVNPTSCCSQLESLDLGSYIHASESSNQMSIESIMACVGPQLGALIPSSPVSSSTYPFGNAHETPLKSLRKLTLPPLFPIDSVVDTMSSLAGSPIESLSVHCYEDDVIETCSALEEFLNIRLERTDTGAPFHHSDSSSSSKFYDKLTRIDVNVSSDESSPSSPEEKEEQIEATKRLFEYCADLKIQSGVAPAKGVSLANKRARASSVDSWPSMSCIAGVA